jgi:hypothetical protein
MAVPDCQEQLLFLPVKKTVDIAEIAEFSGELADEFDLVQFIHPPSGTAQSQAAAG